MANAHLLVTRRFISRASAVIAVVVTASARHRTHQSPSVQLGPRPFYLVEDLAPGPLETELEQCADGPFHRSDFSIGHRGAALQFPEHSPATVRHYANCLGL
jgi:glycerophosphoryl diester phosphodiesterase